MVLNVIKEKYPSLPFTLRYACHCDRLLFALSHIIRRFLNRNFEDTRAKLGMTELMKHEVSVDVHVLRIAL